MKAKIMNFIFRRLIPFSFIDGHKTEIARYVTFVSAVLLIVARFFPQYAVLVDESNAAITMLLGIAGIEIGKMDAEVKNAQK
jgi:hypothetical protein